MKDDAAKNRMSAGNSQALSVSWAWFLYINTLSDTIFTFIYLYTTHKESDNTDYLDNKIEKEKLNACFSEEQACVQKFKRGSEICKILVSEHRNYHSSSNLILEPQGRKTCFHNP